MSVPSFTAEASIYRPEKAYASSLLVAASQMSKPNGLMPQQIFTGITRHPPPWLTDCLVGCSQDYTTCVNTELR